MQVEDFDPEIERAGHDDPRTQLAYEVYLSSVQLIIEMIPSMDQISAEFIMAKFSLGNLAHLDAPAVIELMNIWKAEFTEEISGQEAAERENKPIKMLSAGLIKAKAKFQGGSA